MSYLIERGVNALESIAKSINDSNSTDFGILIASIGTVAVGVGSLIVSKRQLDRDGIRRDNEHFERVRPWVVVDNPKPFHVVYQNNNVDPYDDYMNKPAELQRGVKTISVAFICSNKGQYAAKNIIASPYNSDNPFSRKELEQQGHPLPSNISLAPQQEYSVRLDFPVERWFELDEKPMYLGLNLSYENGRGRSYSGGLYRYSNLGVSIIETWYD